MFCGRADHGMCQLNKKGKRICTTSESFEKEREAFEKKHFSLMDEEEALLKTLASAQKRMSFYNPPAMPPPPPPIGSSSNVPLDMGLRSKAAPSVPGPPPLSAPPPPPGLVRRLSPPPGLSPHASVVDVLGLTLFSQAAQLSSGGHCKAPPPAYVPAPCKAAPAASGRVVAPCKAPPTVSGHCSYLGSSALVALFQTCLRDAEVPEQCWGAAVDWVVQEQAVKVSEVLDNLKEIADVASMRKLPLQRLKLRLMEEESNA